MRARSDKYPTRATELAGVFRGGAEQAGEVGLDASEGEKEVDHGEEEERGRVDDRLEAGARLEGERDHPREERGEEDRMGTKGISNQS